MKGIRYFFLLALVVMLVSCKKFKGGQEIPAYLRIEPWAFTTNYDVEGAATHAITDAWVYVDGNLHGCFEFKSHDDGRYVTIPLLKEGYHDLQIAPGVKLNGISSTRVQYPFYQRYKKGVTFTQGDIATISPATKYYDVNSSSTSMTFRLIEDFEDVNNIQIYRIDSTYADLEQISHRTDPNAWLDPYDTLNHYRSGHIHIGDTLKRFWMASDELTDIPSVGNYVILELDYKCSAEMLVGLLLKSGQQGVMDKELIYLKTTNKWKKTYINLSPIFNENPNIDYAKFYLKGVVTGNASADYYLDNIKLIYR